MESRNRFIICLPENEKKKIQAFQTPLDIQLFLDEIPYRPEDDNFCPASIFRDGRAHCFDGGLFAAAALRYLGYEPSIMQMIPHNDDDHILALFKREGLFGAIAKSNFVGLRFRQPVFRTLRELVMSFFDVFFNIEGEYTLRGYSAPLNLRKFDQFDWECSDTGALKVADRLHRQRAYILFSPEELHAFGKIDPLSYKSGLMVANPAGLFKPKKS